MTEITTGPIPAFTKKTNPVKPLAELSAEFCALEKRVASIESFLFESYDESITEAEEGGYAASED